MTVITPESNRELIIALQASIESQRKHMEKSFKIRDEDNTRSFKEMHDMMATLATKEDVMGAVEFNNKMVLTAKIFDKIGVWSKAKLMALGAVAGAIFIIFKLMVLIISFYQK